MMARHYITLAASTTIRCQQIRGDRVFVHYEHGIDARLTLQDLIFITPPSRLGFLGRGQ